MEVQCYCCENFVYYDRDYYFNKEYNLNDKSISQFSHAKSSDSEEVILMAYTQLAQEKNQYLVP